MPYAPTVTLIALLAALAIRADAQSSPRDSLPFQSGQWGAQFVVAGGVVGAGVLRFGTPTRAWVADLTFALSNSEVSDSRLGGSSESTAGGIAARLGPRWYRPLASGAAAFVGSGARGSFSASDGDQPERQGRTWSAGAYAEVGAQYFVTRQLSVGARWQVDAAWFWSRVEYESFTGVMEEVTSRTISLSSSPVQLLGAIYF